MWLNVFFGILIAMAVIARMVMMANSLDAFRNGTDPDVVISPDKYSDGIILYAKREFGIRDDQLSMDLYDELSIPLGRINNFLEDLHIKLGIPVSDCDSAVVRSIADVIILANERAGY